MRSCSDLPNLSTDHAATRSNSRLTAPLNSLEFERSMISERVKSGLARAKSNGKTLGRPKVSPEREAKILKLRSKGMGILKIGKELGVGTSTVQRVISQ